MARELVPCEDGAPKKKRKSKPYRRRFSDPHLRNAYLEAIHAGLSNTRAAELVGVDPTTVARELLRNAGFAAEVRHASALRELNALKLIHRHAEQSWQAATWFLAHWNRDAWGNRDPDQVTRTELREILNNLAAAMFQGLDPELAKHIAEKFDAIIKAVGGEGVGGI